MRPTDARRWGWIHHTRRAILVCGIHVLGFASAASESNSNPTTGTDIATSTSSSESPTLTSPPSSVCGAWEDRYKDGFRFNITSQEDIDALSNCGTLYGNVLIRSDEVKTITLSGIKQIYGNLEIANCSKLETISAPNLTGIERYSYYNFTLSNLPLLTTLDVSSWSAYIETIDWQSLPLLKEVSTPSEKLGVSSGLILSNTGLATTSLFNLSEWMDEPILISNNPDLNEIILKDLYTIRSTLQIANNGPSAEVYLGELESGTDISIRDAASLVISSLKQITGSLEISNNTFGTFAAPNITEIFGEFIFRNNSGVTNLNLPALQYLGSQRDFASGLIVESNAALYNINLPELSSVYHEITLSGPLENVSMPQLSYYYTFKDPTKAPGYGNFTINSTASHLDCSYFDKLNNKVHTGNHPAPNTTYTCRAVPPGSKKDHATHWKPPFHLSKAGKITVIVIGSIIGAIIIVILLRWQNRHSKPAPRSVPITVVRIGERDGIPLETARVGEDGLPTYTRVGKPGEVPPGYDTHEVSETDVESSTRADEEVGTVTPPVYREPSPHALETERVPSVIEANESSAVEPPETVMRKRGILGQIWYGRAKIPVPVRVGKEPLWRRIWEAAV